MCSPASGWSTQSSSRSRLSLEIGSTLSIICPELLGGERGVFLKSLFGSRIKFIPAFASTFPLCPTHMRNQTLIVCKGLRSLLLQATPQ